MAPPPDVDGDLASTLAPRYGMLRQSLEAATQSVITTALDAGRVLGIAGDLLRRRDALGDTTRDVTLAIDRVEAQAAHAYVESIDAAAEHQKLRHGIDEAFEAMLEEGDERVLYVHAAEAALGARDALASVRAAMNLASLDTSKLDEKLALVDKGLVKQARSLVALNTMRRKEAAALDASEREAAWWFTARSQCDFLVSLYRLQEAPEQVNITQKHNAAHLAVCEDCQRDVESSSLAYTPDHIAASSLWRREHGEATTSEIAFMDAHAKDCKDCKRALEVLAQPEE